MSTALETGTGEGFLARVNSSGRLEISGEVTNTVLTRTEGATVYRSRVTVTSSSGVLVAARTGRQGLRIQVQGANAVYLRFEGADATNEDWLVAAGGEYVADRFSYAGPIRAIAPGGDSAVLVLELA
jgi:hypothetical protein